MKKGKTTKIDTFENYKVLYGTVDSKNLKSLYLNLQTWVEPKKESDNWSRVIMNMSRAVKHSVYNNLDTSLFNNNYIVDLDLRSSGILLNKKSFMNLEINLYLNELIEFKSDKLKKTLNNLVTNIHQDVFKKNNYFDFYLTKNGNIKLLKVKLENV